MKRCVVFSVIDMFVVCEVMYVVCVFGIVNDDILLIVCLDIEVESIFDDCKVVDGDFYFVVVCGVVGGGVVGLFVGLVVVVVVFIGIIVVGVVGLGLVGVLLGMWLFVFVGLIVFDLVWCVFEDEIVQGCILVVIDGEEEILFVVIVVVLVIWVVYLLFDCFMVMM